MNKCLKCGCVFSDEESREYIENHGMTGAEEVFHYCPCCGGDFEEAKQCQCCGEYFTEDELTNGYCEHCIENKFYELKNDVDTCYEIGAEEPQTVSLNCFLTSIFSTEQIEEILMREIRNANVDCRKFLYEDTYWTLNALEDKEVL